MVIKGLAIIARQPQRVAREESYDTVLWHFAGISVVEFSCGQPTDNVIAFAS